MTRLNQPHVVMPDVNPYPSKVDGVYGTFGAGGGIRVHFIQGSMRVESELKQVSLISDIEGSDQWPVQSLFQREVDHRRVNDEIVKWLENETEPKFFSPLTLAFLPIDETDEQSTVRAALGKLSEEVRTEGENSYASMVSRGDFRISRYQTPMGGGEFQILNHMSKAEWDPQRVKVVAIDGQHRLSALKVIAASPAGHRVRDQIKKWRVPVVLLGFERYSDGDVGHQLTLLDATRRVFVLINKEGKKINDCREILLNDTSVPHLATQELIQASHANDCLHINEQHDGRMPLIAFDWRGQEEDGAVVRNPACIIKTEELDLWITNYLLMPEATPTSGKPHGVIPEVRHPLGIAGDCHEDRELDSEFGRDGASGLAARHVHAVREKIKEDFNPGLLHLLENIKPFKDYAGRLRVVARRAAESNYSDVAYHQMRFGQEASTDLDISMLHASTQELLSEIETARTDSFRLSLINLDIGKRAVVSSYGQTWWSRSEGSPEGRVNWAAHAEWFTKYANIVIDSGILGDPDDYIDGDWERFIRPLVRDQEGSTSVANYRIPDAAKGLGSLFTVGVLKHALLDNGISEQEVLELWSDGDNTLQSDLERTVQKYYRRTATTSIRLSRPHLATREIRAEAIQAARPQVQKYLEELAGELFS